MKISPPDQTQIMSKPKPAPLPSGTVVGGYQVIKKLAAGGFGVVYLAEDPEAKSSWQSTA